MRLPAAAGQPHQETPCPPFTSYHLCNAIPSTWYANIFPYANLFTNLMPPGMIPSSRRA
jgi:hypothetical protein